MRLTRWTGGFAMLALAAGVTACSSEGLEEVEMTLVPTTSTTTTASSISKSDDFIAAVTRDGASKEASFPACDGRNILILMSVIDEHGAEETYNHLAEAVLTGSPADKEFTVPGQCSSLRKSVDGNLIYPVYLDFGSDEAGMCAAKARYGGNGRTLNNSGDFHDPC